ncbi:hypothetical protein Aperf_G00000006818 [Anoplocephala perfoliata]
MLAQAYNVPAFLTKLRLLVDDEKTDGLIYWDHSGNSFHIRDGNRLAKDILPTLFKHNNFSSFIRQLNMYGFRKINRADSIVGYGTDTEDMEFSHPYFQRDDDTLMSKIRRKHSSYNFSSSILNDSLRMNEPVNVNTGNRYVVSSEFSRLSEAVRQLKLRQESTDQQFNLLRSENQFLHRQISSLRNQIEQQGSLIQTLFNFISAVAADRRNTGMRLGAGKRKLALTSVPALEDSQPCVEYNIDPKSFSESGRILASNPEFRRMLFSQHQGGMGSNFPGRESPVVEVVSSPTSPPAVPQPHILAIQDVPSDSFSSEKQKDINFVSGIDGAIGPDNPLDNVDISPPKHFDVDVQSFDYPFESVGKCSPDFRLSDIEPSISFPGCGDDSLLQTEDISEPQGSLSNENEEIDVGSYVPKKRRFANRSMSSNDSPSRSPILLRSRRKKGAAPLYAHETVTSSNNSGLSRDAVESFNWNPPLDQADGPLMRDVSMNPAVEDVDEIEDENDATMNDVVNDFLLGPGDQNLFDGLFASSPLKSIGNSLGSPSPPEGPDVIPEPR